MFVNVPDRKELYFFFHEDCGVCKQAHPVFEQWRAAHPDVLAIDLNMARKAWEKYGFSPRKVPAYLFVVNEQPVFKFVGALLKVKDIDAFMKGIQK